MSDEYRIEPQELGAGDRQELVTVIEQAYLANSGSEGGTIAFTEQTFELVFGSPHTPSDLFVRAVHVPSGETVGFLGGLVRTVQHQGQRHQLGVPAWAAVHPAHQRHGLAVRLGMALLELGRERGLDGGLAFFEPEAHGIDMARSVARQAGFAFDELLRIRQFLIRALDTRAVSSVVRLRWFERAPLRALEGTPKTESSRFRPALPSDVPVLLELLGDHAANNELAVVHDPTDFEWYLSHPSVECVVHENARGRPDGFACAWEMQLAGFGRSVPFGWLDLIHLHRLTSSEATGVVRALCRRASSRGWAGLQMPYVPYFSPWPLYRARFVPYPKQLVVALLRFGRAPLPRRVRSLYIDWR